MGTPLEARLKDQALQRGFSLSGIAPATAADGFPRFEHWLDNGFAGEMEYLHRQKESRRHPSAVLAGVKSVMMLGMEYGDRGPGTAELGSTGGSGKPVTGNVARYAQGPDYHRFIWDRLNALADWLMTEVPGAGAGGGTEAAPLLERDFARRAGLGWVGKNTMLINRQRGSFFFLAALLTDLDLRADPPADQSHCGTCTACLDACPTQAFPQPHVLDATRCISYLTIELRSPVPTELREPIGNWVYGCDVCQDVCPWNAKPTPGPVGFPHDPTLAGLDPAELLGLDADAYRARFKKTSLFRNRRAGLLRNAAIVLGNLGDEQALPALQRALNDPEELIREAAGWAIERIRQRTSSRYSGLPLASPD